MTTESKCNCGSSDKSHLFKELDAVIAKYKNQEGSLIMVLHAAQEIFGYLPAEVQEAVAKGLDKTISEVSGVLSFYSFFSTKPRGKNMIRVCLGTACYVRGADKIIAKIKEMLKIDIGGTTADGLFSFEVSRCIGACGLAPAVMINNTVYKHVTPESIETILNSYEQ